MKPFGKPAVSLLINISRFGRYFGTLFCVHAVTDAVGQMGPYVWQFYWVEPPQPLDDFMHQNYYGQVFQREV